MVVRDFRVLTVIGTVLFFVGKQYGYFMARRELRPSAASIPIMALRMRGPELHLIK